MTGVPVQAAPIDPSGLDDAALAAALDEARDREEPRICDELVPLWAETQRRAAVPATEATLEAGNAAVWCAIGEERYDDASTILQSTEAKLGRQVRFDRVALSLHSFLSQLELAVARMDAIAPTDYGEALLQVTPSLVYEISGKLVKAKRPDLHLAFLVFNLCGGDFLPA